MDIYLIEKILEYIDADSLLNLQSIYPKTVNNEIRNRLTKQLKWKIEPIITIKKRGVESILTVHFKIKELILRIYHHIHEDRIENEHYYELYDTCDILII